MMVFAFIAGAIAGQWLPADPVVLMPGEPTVLVQGAGKGLLIRADDFGDEVRVVANGVQLPLKSGPDDTQLVGPAPRTRTLEITGIPGTELDVWHQTTKGESAAWDRYESRLRTWFSKGGELPSPPRSIAATETDWEARREAFLAHFSRPRPALLMGLAQIELQRHRARSRSSHRRTLLGEGRLREGREWTVEVEGPGVLEIQARAEMKGKAHRRFTITAKSSNQPILHSALSTVEHPEFPGLGHLRELSIPIPRGAHTITVLVDGADLRVTAAEDRLRSPVRGAVELWSRSQHPSEDPLLDMERAHVSWESSVAVRRAEELLVQYPEPSHPVHQLARARIIQHSADTNTAVDVWEQAPIGSVGATALVRRWTLHRDVALQQLVAAADRLPADPEWLAAIADALPAGFIRPRGHAIRQLAELPIGADTHSRWTALTPENPLPTLHLVGTRGGIGRVLIRSGQSARVQLPALTEGRSPLLRLSTDTPTRYTINGESREGSGELYEALPAGIYDVEVQRGALLLLDGPLAVGGQFMRERPLTSLPGSFEIPDPGAPAEVELLVSGGTGTVTARTNTGETWQLEVADGLNRFELHLGSWADRLELDGPTGLRASLAMRRALEVDEPFASLEVLNNPLQTLREASSSLHTAGTGVERVALRLIRAAALEALGLRRSARKEARVAAGLPEATPTQRRIAEVILRESQPLALSAEDEGPVTVAAAAAQDGVPYSEGDSLLELLEELSPEHTAPVHLELAREALAEGTVAQAWIHASKSGSLGRVDRLRIASAGHWEHITRVDQSSGSSRSQHGRNAAGLGSSPLRLAQEALLGAPWAPQDGLVLHKSRSAEIELQGSGPVKIEMVCADWHHLAEPPPCEVPVRLNGRSEIVTVPSEGRHSVELGESTLERGLLEVGPLSHPNQALGLLVFHQGAISRPQSQLVQHRIGEGILLRVRGESLLRIRTHGGAEVQAVGGGESARIQGEGILPLPQSGWVDVRIHGDSRSWVSLSRLSPRHKDQEPAAPQQATTLTGTADRDADAASRRWISEVSLSPRTPAFPVGRGGTFQASVLGGLDQNGQRDHRQDYPFAGAQLGWFQRLHDRPDWLSLQVLTRGSPEGFPSISGTVDWVHLEDTWATRSDLSLGYSGAATHLRGSVHVRGLLATGPNWLLQPWVGASMGKWSSDVGDPVDPLVWNTYDLDHFWGATAGFMGDWRPYRNARLRLAAHARSAPEFQLNWAEAFTRADWMLGHNTALTVLSGLGHRFETSYRSASYWRPRLLGRLHTGLYLSPKLRVSLTGDVQWLPLQDGLEGSAALHFQASPRRGLRDFSPLAFPFNAALDSRVEAK